VPGLNHVPEWKGGYEGRVGWPREEAKTSRPRTTTTKAARGVKKGVTNKPQAGAVLCQ